MTDETPARRAADLPEAVDLALATTQVRLHAAMWRRSVALSVLVTVVLLAGLARQLPPGWAPVWLLALAAALSLRALVGWACERVPAAGRSAATWLPRFRLTYFVHGLVWGLAGALLPQALGHEGTDLLLFSLAALMAGSIVATAFDLRASLLFTVPTLLPLLVSLLQTGPAHTPAMAAVLVLFVAVTYLSAQRAQALVREAVLARLAESERRDEARIARRHADEKHQLLVQLQESTDEGFWFVDVNGVTIDVNPAMCRLLGRPAHEIVGRPVFDFFEGEDLALMRREIEARRGGELRGRYEVGIRRPDGTRVYCLNQATSLADADGRPVGSVGIWTDLTARREMEAALRTYERMANSISDLVAVIGEDRVYRVVNDAWCRTSNLTREQALGRSTRTLMGHTEYLERDRALQACFDEQRPMTVLGVVRLPRAQPRLLETTYSPFERDARGVRCAVIVSRDVSDREQARLALETSAEYLRRTLGATGDAIFASEADNADEPVRFHNDQMLAMWGIELAPGEALTPAIIMRHATPQFEDPQGQAALIASIVRGNTAHASRVSLRDGRTLLRRCEPAQVAGRTLRVWSFRDITAEVQVMQQLQRLEADQRALLDAFPGYIGRLDERLVYTYANRGLAAALGGTPEQVVGRPALELLGEARVHELAPLVQRTLAGETVVYEQRPPARDGIGVAHVQVTLAPGRDPRTGAPAIYGFAIDITARKQAEAALIAARDEAQRANQAKSQFLSQMSHELRTPMNAILGFGQLLESDQRPPLAAHQHGWVGEILRGAQHLLGLINEVLDLGRIESGQLLMEPSAVPLAPLLEEALSLTRALAQQHDVQLLPLMGAAAGLSVHADRRRLMQVFLNLLANAIKYNRAGGHVQVEMAVEGHIARIGVQDTGPGLEPPEIARLFQPFERLGAARSGVEGTGIGLALCRRLVEAMDGRIGVDSEPGVGSTFWLRLPLVHTAAVPGSATVVPVAGPASAQSLQHTVLYIEDNPVNVALMEAMLSRLPGLQLVTAALPAEGLRLARQLRPSLVLLDIQLPGMDGFGVLARLRSHASTRDIPVIAVSANALSADVDAAMAAGFLAYLTKPLDLDTLLATVRRVLQGSTQPG